MLSSSPKNIKIVEVGPRDGLQNEKQIVSLKSKLKYLQMLTDSGLTHIEATSFVRKDKIPQMGDAVELFQELAQQKSNKASYISLVPNEKGMENALKVGVSEVAFFTATSETFNKKNINASIQESIEKLKPVAQKAQDHNIKLRAYISTVFGCPYEGQTSEDQLLKVIEQLFTHGAYEISLGDTTGVAEPRQVQSILQKIKKHFDSEKLALHFHDTYGLALTNIFASLEEGMSIFDSSSGGLGGCPYAHGASGNVATEDVLYLMQRLGIKTGVDIEKLFLASQFILNAVGKESPSKVYQLMNQNNGKLKGF